MAIHESGQMYLETIYILSQDSAFVRAIDVGEQLGFTFHFSSISSVFPWNTLTFPAAFATICFGLLCPKLNKT